MLALAALGLLPAAASAQRSPAEPSPLAITSSLERLAVAFPGSTDTTIEPAVGGAASHADQLIYTARFTNQGPQVLDAVRITSPIPADLRYLPQSATGPASAIVFSIDHARTFGPPAELTVVRPDGAGRRVADAADYTHVRWILEGALDPGATGVVRFGAVPR